MTASQPASTIPPENLSLYEQLVASAGLERKGDTMPYTALHGNMFSYLDKDGQLALRLPAEARAAFLAKYETPPVMPNGVAQPEYVYVPADLLADTLALAPYFAQSVAYARGLKPKPTTSNRAAKATSASSRRRAIAKHEAATKKKKRLAKRKGPAKR